MSLVLSKLLCAHYAAAADNVRAIFLFKDVMKSNTTALKTSGFNTLIMFGIGILDSGDIKYYSNTPGSKDVVVASKGAYVGGSALADKVPIQGGTSTWTRFGHQVLDVLGVHAYLEPVNTCFVARLEGSDFVSESRTTDVGAF